MTSIAADRPATVPTGRTRAELRGRAAGSGILAFFAFGWTGCGISALPATVGLALLAVAGLTSATVAALAIRNARRAATAPAGGDPARGKATGRRFGLVVTAEWIGIFVAVRLLGTFGHTQLIPAAIALGVGIHFFPLARLFSLRAYHLTGTALCLIALATALLAPLAGTDALWTMLPGFGSALTLYATCTHLLRTHTTR
ncbi:hypothetical protein [Streptomyces gilvosporeus]|uniref:Uncharacterized protein n=1 Tax=Streptomyces gilvosporeus TaxID=553510 RepID=A0A1V0U1R4_9ACTN|nr:hypothetical protein [Streptomyces gilvosporeus]ARF58872.1 hypothetical protein B1H19_36000 [Streptomyces gilvosporeus]